MKYSKAAALRPKAGRQPVNAQAGKNASKYGFPDLTIHPEAFDLYDLCAGCVNGERREVSFKGKPNILKFREKPKPKIRVIYGCMAKRCIYLKPRKAC